MVIEIYNGVAYQCSDKYSNKDFTGHDLSVVVTPEGQIIPRTDMSGIVIHGSCFSHETPNAQIFPSVMTGTTFLMCNLDNVFVPPGNTVIACSTRRFQAQNDDQDWLLNATTLKPIQPLNLAQAIKNGLNTNPALIPGAVSAPSLGAVSLASASATISASSSSGGGSGNGTS